MKKVIVLLGGMSAENSISLITGEEIYKALLASNISVEKFYLDDDILQLIRFLENNKDIVVFNALHGKFGEDGRIQSILDFMRIPYTHSGVRCSAICMDKIITKELAKLYGIPVAKHQAIVIEALKSINIELTYPFVMKPVDEGSSVDIFLIHNTQELKNSVDTICTKYSKKEMMIEEYIKGIECTVGVLKGKSLAVTEITPINAFYDYNAKYTTGGSKHVVPPISIPIDIQDKMKAYSELLYTNTKARGAIRVDFIYRDSTNEIFLLEVNTQPGMTPVSLLPEQASYLGISFSELCKQLVDMATFDN